MGHPAKKKWRCLQTNASAKQKDLFKKDREIILTAKNTSNNQETDNVHLSCDENLKTCVGHRKYVLFIKLIV